MIAEESRLLEANAGYSGFPSLDSIAQLMTDFGGVGSGAVLPEKVQLIINKLKQLIRKKMFNIPITGLLTSPFGV